jgi:regulator of sirC expression with transglutaminase-like and TPR domain
MTEKKQATEEEELQKLKAMAFDLLVQQKQVNQSLQAVNQQIIELQKNG